MATKKALKKAFEIQLEGLGYTLVDPLSLSHQLEDDPGEAFRYLEERMEKEYPLGVFKDITKD